MTDSDSDNSDNPPRKNIFGFSKKPKSKKDMQKNINDDISDDIDWDNQEDMDLGSDDNTHASKSAYHSDDDIYAEDEQYKDREFLDKDKPRNILSKIIFKIIFALIIILIASIVFFNHKSNRSRGALEIPLDSGQEILQTGDAKLPQPLIGGNIGGIEETDISRPPEETDIQDPNDALINIDFDYSPLMKNTIARKPMLPDKVQQKITQTTKTTNEFQDLWQNGTDTATGKNASINTSSDPQNTGDEVPAWRRYAVNYETTGGLPTFSIVLEYDDIALTSSDLPRHTGYNAVIAGFTQKSQKNLDVLRKNKIEPLLYLPMEEEVSPLNLNPLKTTSSYDDIREAIAFHTSQLGGVGFVGFMNYGGDAVRQNVAKINFAMSVLAKTGFLYLDDNRNTQQSYAFASAEGQKIPTLKTQIYIKSVKQQFASFINQVKLDGTGVAIVKATPENIKMLDDYENFITKSQVKRIPISGILKSKML